MNREELKTLWFNLEFGDNRPGRKEIIVDLRYLDNKWWPNYGYIEVVSDGPSGYSRNLDTIHKL